MPPPETNGPSYYITHGAAHAHARRGVGAVVADVGAVTIQSLQDAGIEYDELHFGKPWAQFYIDDCGVNAYADLEKELGYYPPYFRGRGLEVRAVARRLDAAVRGGAGAALVTTVALAAAPRRRGRGAGGAEHLAVGTCGDTRCATGRVRVMA